MPVIAPGRAAQDGMPDTRELKSARRCSHLMRPARCAMATQITSAVAAVAAAVPQITSRIAAPFAGSFEAEKVKSVLMTLPRTGNWSPGLKWQEPMTHKPCQPRGKGPQSTQCGGKRNAPALCPG